MRNAVAARRSRLPALRPRSRWDRHLLPVRLPPRRPTTVSAPNAEQRWCDHEDEIRTFRTLRSLASRWTCSSGARVLSFDSVLERELIPLGSTSSSCALSSLSTSRLALWTGLGIFNVKIPALGILWSLRYCLHVAGIKAHYQGVVHISFRFQLVGQMALLFAATTVVAIAWWASAHAAEVTEEEHATRSGLEELKAALSRCEAQLSTNAPSRNRERQLLLKLNEDARYLSPSRDPSAISYEQQMVALVDDIRLRLEETASPLTSSPLDEDLGRCAALMALRKQIVVR